MKVLYRVIFGVVILGLVGLAAFMLEIPLKNVEEKQIITNWQYKLVDEYDPELTVQQLNSMEDWININSNGSLLKNPFGVNTTQWVKITLPDLHGKSSAILFEQIMATNIIVKIDEGVLYRNDNKYNNSINTVLVPLSAKNSYQTLYVGLENEGNTIGVNKSIVVGDYQELTKGFVRNNTATYILGSTLVFIALIMLICALFIDTGNLSMWISLCAVILCSGFLVITYSPFSHWLHESKANLYEVLFDLSMFILLPAFSLFFEKTIGPGIHSIVRMYRRFQVCFSILLTILLFIQLSTNQLLHIYGVISVNIQGITMIVQFLLLICISTIYAIQGDKNAIIFSTGFIIFALIGTGELIFFFLNKKYELFMWKWGILCFLISLIIILGRKFTENHYRVVQYSKQLEMFNNELQRSERVEIISELAASVAHEVRNPLQVTRGFIQLLAEKDVSEKLYLTMALEELDRASDIITDYLAFAKPEAGIIKNLNVLEQFIHIEGILVPMANMQGGSLSVHIPSDVYIRGNSSKFKQAFINLIKNSIESLQGEGEIQIWAYEEKEMIVIHVKDTGEGMDQSVLARLGEPYFSNKSKGTGLGLMVTFRIIEVMEGTIRFQSQKGIGTEAIIRFPKVSEQALE